MSEPLVNPEEPEGEAPAVPAVEPSPGISADEFSELKAELSQANSSIKDLRDGYQYEHAERARLEAGMQSVVAMRQQEQQAAAQAAAMREPDIAWDKFEEPDLMRETLSKHGAHVMGQIFHALQPYADAARTADRNSRLTQASSTAQAVTQTREDWKSSGYSMNTWGEVEGEFRDYLKGNPDALEAALHPGGGKTQAFHFASQRGLEIQAAPKDALPIQSGATPPAGDGTTIDAELSPLIDRVKKNLGLPADWQPTADELEEIQESISMGPMGR